ncbi:hypothetical protein A3709_15850 [Halioglobus sp. HI00S01]|uniref:MarR family winged helix-turn-helix transcriptional regulator n=1 Tax=Halioglobus sp. HI00S01 TaxID=1822214 RepID=UPI0007C3D8C0|nr:MarR family transcriptional regulator [Halioglobus sp. HI00S01]KZX59028.1 hypothetical protein A3709_15850 [Halioglobus sp. HI00S01]
MSSLIDYRSTMIYFISMSTAINSNHRSLLRHYRDNFARHILAVSIHLQSEIMNALTVKHGHSQLRINFEPYMNLAGEHGARLSDIATRLGISRQAANQAVNQIERAGYVERTPDPQDGRAKLLTLTDDGKSITRQGAREAMQQQSRLADIIGEPALDDTAKNLATLSRKLGLFVPDSIGTHSPLVSLLPRLADTISNKLMELTIASGHPRLKRSFGPVLIAIGPHGGRIQQIAEYQDVSKQAISATVAELVTLGYIQRCADPDDARQLVVTFTKKGLQLIADSIAAVQTLKTEFSLLMGKAAFAQVTAAMAEIYRVFQLESDVFGQAYGDQMDVIIRNLNRELGPERARELAERILATTPETIGEKSP